MHRRVSALALVVLLGDSAAAQVQMRPTPAPIVTAESEPWYLDGQPITYAGQFYYPAGALVFFNSNEMVRSGAHFGVPLFTRTTIEPFSIVYVPVGGGLMQPYERPRSGELAGTVGSRTPSFPVAMVPSGATVPSQAAAPPMLGGFEIPAGPPAPVMTASETERAVGTSGAVPAQPHVPMHVRIGDRPTGLNAIYIDFDGTRWFSTGTTIDVDAHTSSRIGEYHGFPVWRGAEADRIYVATSRSGSGLAVPYSRQRTPLAGGVGAVEAGKIR